MHSLGTFTRYKKADKIVIINAKSKNDVLRFRQCEVFEMNKYPTSYVIAKNMTEL